jgi:hypothetical protein
MTTATIQADAARSRRMVLFAVLHVVAALVYLFGLIAPLTPSHGLPSIPVLLVFVGGPLALFVWASRLSRWWVAKLVCYLAIALVLGLSCYLLLMEWSNLRWSGP